MRRKRNVLLGVLLWASLAAPVLAAEAAVNEGAHEYFTDVELINQDGEKLRLYSDLMEGKVVIVNVIFTTCQGVCPVTMGNLVKIQKHLGDRLGKDVNILSLTVDREVDTPERLQEFGERFGSKPGWHFLTGTPENLDFALRKLGLWVADKEAHSAVFLVGNVPTGLWKKAFGMAGAGELARIVDSVIDDREETASTTGSG
jgi:protein SCO1/2